ncbi:MAG: hypothetical protein ChlgKO_06970 [Chlamydiales bacterium]
MDEKILYLLIRIEQRLSKLFARPSSGHRVVLKDLLKELLPLMQQENSADGVKSINEFTQFLETEKENLEFDPLSEDISLKLKEFQTRLQRIIRGETKKEVQAEKVPEEIKPEEIKPEEIKPEETKPEELLLEKTQRISSVTIDERLKLVKLAAKEFLSKGKDAQVTFKQAIHSFSESAATSKLSEVVRICVEMETVLSEPIQYEQLPEWEVKVETFIQDIEKAFVTDVELESEKSPSVDGTPPLAVQVDQSFDTMMVDLAHNYCESCQAKMEDLEACAKNVLESPSKENITFLKQFLGNFASSAGSYGYPKLGRFCKDFCYYLEIKEIGMIDIGIPSEMKEKLEELPERIREFLNEQPVFTFEEEKKSKEVASEIDLYVVHDNPEVLKSVEKEGRTRGLNVMVESDPSAAEAQLSDGAFRAKFIVINARFIDNYNWIDAYRKNKGTKAHFGLIYDSLSLENRLTAMEKNIDHLFEMPLSTEQVLQAARSVADTDLERPFRILVLDDDPDICKLLKVDLEEVRFKVKTIQDPNIFFTALGQFKPDLLLLDINLPEHDGLSLLKSIRADAKYSYLPVMVITASNDDETIAKAFSMKVEDFIIKPIKKTLLQARVTSFSRIQSKLMLSQDYDSLTGLHSKRSFYYLLQGFLERITDRGVRHTLCLIGIDQYEEFFKAQSPHFAEQLQLIVANNLRKTFWSHNITGKAQEGIFSLLLEGVDVGHAKKQMEEFIETVLQDPFFVRNKHLQVAFSVGISTYPLDGTDANALMLTAQKAQREAQIFDGIKILSYSGEKSVVKNRKEICSIDDDPDIHNILRFSFEKRGFGFTALESCEEARKYFHEKKGEMPNIVVIDRILTDGDGIELYRELKADYPNFPPVMFLTSLSAADDVLSGLKEGAVDYIIKPFTMSILVQKITKIIEDK